MDSPDDSISSPGASDPELSDPELLVQGILCYPQLQLVLFSFLKHIPHQILVSQEHPLVQYRNAEIMERIVDFEEGCLIRLNAFQTNVTNNGNGRIL